MKKFFVLILLSGCANIPTAYEKMSPEQLKELAKMKDSNVACIIGNSPWGRVVSVFVNVDRGVIQNGVVSVDDQCKVSVSNEAKK